MRTSYALCAFLVASAALGAGCAPSNPAAPTEPSAAAAPLSMTTAGEPNGPEIPPFNLQAILRPLAGNGFGHVKFRQPNDDNRIVYLDVWVRDLAPNTDYRLQRAADGTLDGQCTSNAWLTLGVGLTPQAITTDASGTGRAALSRDLGAFAVGFASDIHFRIVEASSLLPVLQSECYRFVVTQ